jgi:hypothetical protein
MSVTAERIFVPVNRSTSIPDEDEPEPPDRHGAATGMAKSAHHRYLST